MHHSRYSLDRGRFISEFGIAGAPTMSTLRHWESGDLRGMQALERRAKDGALVKAAAIMGIETGVPDTLDDYVRASMACQAEGLKHGIEHYRRRQPHCSGTLIWQLNDSWPGFSWSLVDYDLRPKAAYYYVRRAFAPVLATFLHRDDGHVELWVTNSSQDDCRLALTVTIADFDGAMLEQETLAYSSAPMTSEPVWQSSQRVSTSHYAWVDEADGVVPSNRAFFSPIRTLPLPTDPVTVDVDRSGEAATVHLKASGYSYFTEIVTSSGVTPIDNYFDLRPGQAKLVTIPGLADDAEVEVRSYRC
jgi:beta-mannosidase